MRQKTDKPILPKEKPNYVVIEDGNNKMVDKLFEIYEKDKAKARAYYYMNNNTSGSYTTTRTVAFDGIVTFFFSLVAIILRINLYHFFLVKPI
jgi:hypothetical protein